MRTYILRRILWMIPTMLIILVISYAMMRQAPGSPARSMMFGTDNAGEGRKAEESVGMREFRKQYHLDRSWVVGFWYWLTGDPNRPDSWGILGGDFGVSISVSRNKPVWDLVMPRLWVTMRLNLWSMAVVYLVALPAGVYFAIRPKAFLSKALGIFFFLLYSMPSFWVGLLLILIVARISPSWPLSGLQSGLPPDASYSAMFIDAAKHYVLPVFCLSFGSFALLSRITRTSMLEVIRQDYVRTARAKGLDEKQVICRHVIRNSLVTLVTVFAGILPGLISGSMLIEFLFNIHGMGMLSITALSSRDYPLLMTLLAMSAGLTLIAFLISDIIYVIVDPTIRLE